MKPSTKRALVSALFLSIRWMALPAQAHQPYIMPVGDVVAPDGQRLRVELLFGDGILWEDPGRGQLRDEQGRVVGRTPVGLGASGSCPLGDPQSCRVFIQCGAVLPPCTWTPDFTSVDWEARTFIGASWTRTGDPYPEYDKAPAPVGFARDLAFERSEASLIQKLFMFGYFGPFLAFSALIGCWAGAIYATRRARSAELRWRGRVVGSRVLGIAAWFVVALLVLPCFGLGILVSYWKLPLWLVASVLGGFVALRRLAERRFLPEGHWARGSTGHA